VPETDWKIELFRYGNIFAERIDFSIDGHDFLMVFTPVSEINDQETLAQKSEDVGFIIPDNSYDVKFDRIENFESGDFYASPSSGMDLSQLNRLGIGIKADNGISLFYEKYRGVFCHCRKLQISTIL